MRIVTALCAVALLGGCAEYLVAGSAVTQAGIADVRKAKDIEAGVVIESPCLAGLGAAGRVLTPEQLYHAVGLCWPSGRLAEVTRMARPVTIDDARGVVDFLNRTVP